MATVWRHLDSRTVRYNSGGWGYQTNYIGFKEEAGKTRFSLVISDKEYDEYRHSIYLYSYDKPIGTQYRCTVTFKDSGYPTKTEVVEYTSRESGYRTIDLSVKAYRNSSPSMTLEIEYLHTLNPPSTPSRITVPSQVKEGEKISISWGSGSYATSYRLYRSINGGSYTQIYSGSSRSRSETALASWNTVRYRVRSYNVDGYSSYRTSSTITVKHFPEFQMRVNGSLKTSDMGWVKVNGILREIDSIHVKVNGALKEVE